MNSDMNSVIIDGVEYRPVSPTSGDRVIVVADRGWVLVGTRTDEDDEGVTLTDASVIRYWGTTKGLGQLAMEGPTDKTKLDPIGDVRIPASSVVMVVQVAAGVNL